MIGYFEFERVELDSLEYLRKMQVKELKCQVQDFIEEGIVTYKADCMRILAKGEDVGYACIGTYEYYKDIILEYYLIDKNRVYAEELLKQIAKDYGCKGWFVNSQDFFALPIMLDSRLPFEINGYIFEIDNTEKVDYKLGQGLSFETTGRIELQEVYELIIQDDFYTGGGIETVEEKIAKEILYSLRLDGRLIGVGFAGILKRTPGYADIAMIIDPHDRQKGWGTFILKALINQCRLQNIIPTACCDVNNNISRRTLQKAGFYLDGCMLLVRIE